jgi:Flp pilus assembly protein TadD
VPRRASPGSPRFARLQGVALKVVDRGPDAVRFRAEQKILATLEHPARFLNNLALVDQQSGRLPEAEESFRKAITLKRERYDQHGLALSLEAWAKSF